MYKNISVALATYNGEKYISELLNSIKSQKLLPHELVVSDDCSIDRTLEIIEEFAESATFEVFIIKNRELKKIL